MRELEPSLGRFAFLTRWHSLHLPCGVCNGPFISPDSNHSSRNSTFSKQHFSPRDDQHGGKGCNFGQTAGPSLIKFGTREGGREGMGGQGRGANTYLRVPNNVNDNTVEPLFLIRPPSESHWCGRIRGMVAREGFVHTQNALSVTRNVVV